MPILNKDEAQTLLKKVLSYSKADECEVAVSGSEGGNIRYALNAVSTASDIGVMSLEVTSVFGKQAGTTTIDNFDDAALERVVRRWEELAQFPPPNPEYMPVLGPQTFAD